MKVVRTVWDRGKGGDNLKALPIVITTHQKKYSASKLRMLKKEGMSNYKLN